MFKRRKSVGVAQEVVRDTATTDLVTQELYRKNVELAHTNRMLSLLRRVDELVLEPHISIEDLAVGISKAIVASSTYAMCGLFVREYAEEDNAPYYLKGYSFVEIEVPKPVAKLLQRLRLNPALNMFVGEDKSELLSIDALNSTIHEQVFGVDAHVVARIADLSQTKSFCIVKLQARRQTVGVLMVGMLDEVEKVSQEDRSLLERLSEAIGVAIDNKLLFEENQKVLRKLKLTNHKLKALDEAKDEFISMASHQLRTPLTSVKGYLSMLEEGDAGKLNVSQKQFVNQALISSQRMVYLIADLLNVSRLRTGKFIIEPTPVYLPDMIESEIAQLKETVKSRGLTLNFAKPKSFPTLNLDETKLRQVVMNFTDNAIYYTPKGGEVKLSLQETPQMIEFTVTDNGIGVPNSERHHLFTKFYRAGNARKTRPDGTGLGLFMAKKVIVAQGGALIFKSQEGKGSTFGFSFEKSKLLVPNKE